jgi:hypothetical protein
MRTRDHRGRDRKQGDRDTERTRQIQRRRQGEKVSQLFLLQEPQG